MYWLKYLLKEPFHALKTREAREFVRLLTRYGDKQRHVRSNVQFAGYRISVPDLMSFLWQYKEIFVDEFYFFKADTPSPVIYDCGANVGMSVIYFKKLFPNARITAFEAEPAIAAMLTANLKNNQVQGVSIVDKAVWKDNEGVWFGSETADSSSIFSLAEKKKISSVRLKDYLTREASIDFLKIDIEGAETDVLEDCRTELGRVKNLFVEFHSYIGNQQGLANIMQIIEENGFRYYIDTNQHRTRPFVNHQYKNNDVMDLQLNISCWRE
ncbi:FkbM family methyltransferase [Dyadobacter sandarakinus]|uniref:FkbM family methyltransferase n=1 Tax=Dyadobacter sandarakinus TaxID=2747268 RepID=A0ABX7I7V9_9BACT|nr:FkbM family methyltransferase [Dyadobacter sandarakinus]QRR01928.1 FkbM family methyltransferase [Dyadobacter sandarakinus]